MKLHIIIYLSLLLFLGSGCSDFLDVQPKDKQSEEQLFATRGGFYTAVNGIYNKLASSSLYGKNLTYEMIDILAFRYTPLSVITRMRLLRLIYRIFGHRLIPQS